MDPQGALQAVSLITPLLVIVVTGYGALWVARKVERAALLQGFLVGLVVALLSFLLDLVFSWRIDPVGLILYVLMVAAGLLGGILGSRR
jgi:putative membrane protein (TIGR04086 family)